jgi:hypothetical protein
MKRPVKLPLLLASILFSCEGKKVETTTAEQSITSEQDELEPADTADNEIAIK